MLSHRHVKPLYSERAVVRAPDFTLPSQAISPGPAGDSPGESVHDRDTLCLFEVRVRQGTRDGC